MKFLAEVPQKKVLDKALSLVRSATQEILTTMDVDEEARIPLPPKYHSLIEKKAQEGVSIRRYGFGTLVGFEAVKKKGSSVLFYYTGDIGLYQRMLVIDRKRGLCKIGETVYYTEFKPLITALVQYVTLVYNKEDP